VASEREKAQTYKRKLIGVRTTERNTEDSRNVLGKHIKEGENPVDEIQRNQVESRVLRDTRNLAGRRGDHPPRLNTPWWPIEKKYCEGKVKRTPGGEWKRTWNPMFTSSRRCKNINCVLFVERSGELLMPARLSTKSAEPKGNQVWRGRKVSISRPETGWPTHGRG